MSAFEFDCFGAAFLHQSQRVPDSLVIAGVERSIRHVGDQQRALDRATHGLQVDQYVLERHRHGVAVTQNDIAKTITDKNHVDACFINDARSWIVVGGETNEAFAALFT